MEQFAVHLMPHLLTLANDRVPNVRVLLAKTLRQTLLEKGGYTTLRKSVCGREEIHRLCEQIRATKGTFNYCPASELFIISNLLVWILHIHLWLKNHCPWSPPHPLDICYVVWGPGGMFVFSPHFHSYTEDICPVLFALMQIVTPWDSGGFICYNPPKCLINIIWKHELMNES